MKDLTALREKKAFICDMDGVIYRGSRMVDGADKFISWLQREGKKYLFLTNASGRSPRELSERLLSMGLQVGEEHFLTSSQITAAFISKHSPGASVYVIGGEGLVSALLAAGLRLDEENPDYVVFGATDKLDYYKLARATVLVSQGARLIGANSDVAAPMENCIMPACGALIAPIERATGKTAYFIGKPNPLAMRSALDYLGASHSDAVMVGDTMETDILAGMEMGLDTVLVLSGVTEEENVAKFPYRPTYILGDVGDIAD